MVESNQSTLPLAGLSIVLFGMPGSGKSSLLGALVQAARSQAALLGGTLEGIPEALEQLRRQVYDNKLTETHEEVVPYDITFLPADGSGQVSNTFIDCDGRVAQEYLTGAKSLDDAGAPAPLAEAIRGADALVLTVDAASSPAHLEEDFARFGNFLRYYEEHRGRHNETAGLPVYLVLTKCDHLAKADDTSSRWLQKIEEGKRKIDERFRDFLAREGNAGTGLFGTIDLHLWATATKRPALSDKAAKPSEPFGVAELFRQVLESGQSYQSHQRHTHRRLMAAVGGVALLVILLGIVAAAFFLTRPSADVTALANAVRRALPGPTAVERLREPLNERLCQLADIQANNAFAQLPVQTQEEVRSAMREIKTYQSLNEDFKAQAQEPRFITRDEDVVKNEKFLDSFALPGQYAQAWSDTKMAQRHQQWRHELTKLREAVNAEETWVREQIKEGELLRKRGGLVIAQTVTPQERDHWFAQVKAYANRDFRGKRSDRLPGTTTLTYDNVYRFQRVDLSRRAWENAKKTLEELRKQAQ